ncbi:YrdB family protein [Actinoplanes oblitus]|uniref:YrdB family protein n=1 Tax=Actinoplanes oblitus TaxID=3040509 RepID=A0ABY8WQT9_9ACTN|nr:YrdB family protein [Actinoplanes oblitus]WIM99453.1 YrdB family protein [Actinoplanes oblitus]
MRAVILTLRFVLELCALAALAYGGWRLPAPIAVRILAAVLLPLIAALIWGRWVAPRGSHLLPDPVRLIPEWAVFGGATVALILTGHPVLGGVFAVSAAVDRWLLHVLKTSTGGEPA